MKIRAERKALAETVAWVTQAIPKTPNVPVLAGIRLRAADGTLTLSAFDYEVAHEARVNVDLASEGECLVSGSFLRTILGALTAATVELVLDGGTLTISSGRSTYRTQTMRLADYPNLPDRPAEVGTVDAGDLAGAVDACSPPVDDAAPSEGVRGLRLEATSEGVEIVGLSGQLLINRALDWSGEDFAVTVPSRTVGAAAGGLAGTVTVGVSESALGLSDAERTVVLRTMSGKFADWRKVPRAAGEDRFAIMVDRDELAGAVKRATLLAKVAKDGQVITLVIEPDSIEITAADGIGNGSEVVDAAGDGREEIHLNPGYVTSALAAMPPGPVRLGIGKRRSPDMGAFTTIRPGDGSDDREAVVAARRGGEAR